MKHLTTSTDPQSLFVLPRVLTTSIKLVLTDDSTKKVVNITPNIVLIGGNYIKIFANFNLIEGRFYSFKVHNSTDNSIIYRDTIYCTDNNNTSDYTSVSSNNEFIIL